MFNSEEDEEEEEEAPSTTEEEKGGGDAETVEEEPAGGSHCFMVNDPSDVIGDIICDIMFQVRRGRSQSGDRKWNR